MRYIRQSDKRKAFAIEVRALEERLFHNELDEKDRSRMKSGRYSWHYRPSHHVQTGLMTRDDITFLRKPGKRLLSVGAYPGFFEQVLCALGIPPKHILLTDNDPDITLCGGLMKTVEFDASACWPDIGTFDQIIFPESLCMCVAGALKMRKSELHTPTDAAYSTDELESEVLATILEQALKRLRPGGVIRANGPMSHPNVVKAMGARLRTKGIAHLVDYERFFLSMRKED